MSGLLAAVGRRTGLLLTQQFFVRAGTRSKIPTTFYPQKTALVARIGNYLNFALCTHPTHENRLRWSETKNLKLAIPDNIFFLSLIIIKLCTLKYSPKIEIKIFIAVVVSMATIQQK